MKKVIFLAVALMLTAVFATNGQAQNKKDTLKLQAAAASVTSETPGIDGVQNIIRFEQGDASQILNINSSRRFRKSAVNMAYEMYKLGYFDYELYTEFAKSLGIKPRRAVKK